MRAFISRAERSHCRQYLIRADTISGEKDVVQSAAKPQAAAHGTDSGRPVNSPRSHRTPNSSENSTPFNYGSDTGTARPRRFLNVKMYFFMFKTGPRSASASWARPHRPCAASSGNLHLNGSYPERQRSDDRQGRCRDALGARSVRGRGFDAARL
jgi:hypothetical protein